MSEPTTIEIEFEALKTVRAGYDSLNALRALHGQSPAYGDTHYFDLAQRMRELIKRAKPDGE